MSTFFIVLAILFSLGMAAFGQLSLRENEPRAARLAFYTALASGALFTAAAFLPQNLQALFLFILGLGAVGLIILFLIPFGKIKRTNEDPKIRIDERDIMFARARLTPGSPNYTTYYQLHPEKLTSDDETRALPGLLSSHAGMANPFLFSAANGSFALTNALREAVDGPLSPQKVTLPAEKSTATIKSLARYYGALDVGIAKCEPYHFYSHIGRGSGVYGSEIEPNHAYAIAFTVEMAHAMINAGPFAPGVTESAKQYVEAARTAVQLAAAIREMGYEARAHIDGNYRVVAPLVARDAGLGEIGRMGLLITPHLGPRVRLGVVTTNLPLTPDGRQPDASVIDFCSICKKCADCCPSKSIPFADRGELDGVLRWQINAESCFRYWSKIGTDCGRCMAVCPYSHPDNLAHNMVRWGIQRSDLFRRSAIKLDDFFYGKRPAPHAAPEWTRVLQKSEIDD